jgi:threonyl-tRNA synthetase
MIHRAIYGTLERFIAILIEHFAGAFPLWLAPIQLICVPIADRHVPYAEAIAERLREHGYRVRVDDRRQKMQARIRDAQKEQVPYMLVIGDRDVEGGTVSIRERRDGDMGSAALDDFIAVLDARVASRD